MKDFLLASVLIGALLISPLHAQEPPTIPHAGDFIEVPSDPNIVIYYAYKPLTTERFVFYGQLKKGREGGTEPDLKDASSVIQPARDARDRLLLIRDERGFFALTAVVVLHSTITFAKRATVTWDYLFPLMEKELLPLEN